MSALSKEATVKLSKHKERKLRKELSEYIDNNEYPSIHEFCIKYKISIKEVESLAESPTFADWIMDKQHWYSIKHGGNR